MPDREPRDDLGETLWSDEIWDGPSPHVKDAVLAAIAAEIAAAPVVPITPELSTWAAAPKVGLEPHRAADAARRRYRLPGSVATVAAGVLVAVGLLGAGFVVGSAEPSVSLDDEFVLEGSDLASVATAKVGLVSEPSGWEIGLQVDGLGPAEKGSYYAAWLQGPDGVVPIGSFHLRGGEDKIVLWAGVDLDLYDTLLVTVQLEAEPPHPSKNVVLAGSR